VGLDLYVGSLTRYLAGDWELITQRIAREIGLEMEVVRLHDPEGAIRDQGLIRPVVVAWRDQLSAALGDRLDIPLNWNEGENAPYFTDKPTWDCYSDLILWAAYEEQQGLLRPEGPVEDWSQDIAYQSVTSKEFRSKYSHLYDVQLWLPCPFDCVFETEDVSGDSVLVGSSVVLQDQLRTLNGLTWRYTAKELDTIATQGAEHGAPLEVGARFAFSIFTRLTHLSVEHKLPVRMDW